VNHNGGRRGGWLWLAVLVVSALLVTVGIWQRAQDQPVVAVGQPSAAAPSSPSATASTPNAAPKRKQDKGEPGLPKRLRIPRLKLSMPIIATTVDKTGQMALPDRPTQIGWYAYGPGPGAREGSAVLGGHVDSREYGVGPLAGLGRLARSDKIIIVSQGERLTYRVDSIRQISKLSVPLAEIFDRSGPPRLRIVTCGGPYLPSRGGYRDNLILTATQQ
jgi:sortase (surface protein transpeptidase)